MYRLMMSEKITRDHMTHASMSSYKQIEVGHFTHFLTALEACEIANFKGISRFYVLNELGEEYYDCSWID
jgi:hypothetical protein